MTKKYLFICLLIGINGYGLFASEQKRTSEEFIRAFCHAQCEHLLGDKYGQGFKYGMCMRDCFMKGRF